MQYNYKIKIGTGLIIRPSSQSYLDQIDGETIVSSKRIKEYLYNKYRLTEEEYYNLVMYGSINNYPSCQNPRCNNHPRFIRLSIGYQKYCCDSCKNSSILTDIVNKIPWSNERRNEKSRLTRNIQLDKIEKKDHNFLHQSDDHKFNAQLESAKFTFIKRASIRGINKGYLYYGLVDKDNFKIGVTFVSPYSRYKSQKLKTIHTLLTSSIHEVAEIEYRIKLKFKEYSTYTKETFSTKKFRDILNEIKSLL